jgi:parvulin-like peptidyl-prolyl isomerase
LSNLTKALILIGVVLLIGVGLVAWKKKVGGHGSVSYNSISRAEVESLLNDVAKNNPMLIKRWNEDPETVKKQMGSLKEMLAFASQAQRDGMADSAAHRQELQNIRAEVIAVNYDREMNKDKGPMPPFGFITEEQINAFWAQQPGNAPQAGFLDNLMGKLGLGAHAETRSPEEEFNDFLNAKIEIMKAGNPEMKDREISEEEKTQAKEMFAKMRIYAREFDQKAASGEISKEFVDKTMLQVKLQQAQFLARLFSEASAERTKVTDAEIDAYIAAHPELDTSAKRQKAQSILDRAKAGEDFAALANEFTEDPGNKGPDGTLQGGIYKDVTKGRMVPQFEAAALALEEGQVSPELVETNYGYHIVKLERKLTPVEKDGKTSETYDVRHILISTGYKDPEKPNSREMPVKDYVRAKLEEEKNKKLLEEVIANNAVEVPEDFTIPQITDEQMQEFQQKQQSQMPGGPGAPGAAPQVDVKPRAGDKKPETKKK